MTKKEEAKRSKELKTLLDQLVEAARDSTMLDTTYYLCTIEGMFRQEPITITLPENKWIKLPQQGANPDRRLTVDLYIMNVKAALHKQGIKTN